MDTKVFDHIYNQQPKFNQEIAEGLSSVHLREAEQFVNRVWECAEQGFPEGLRYEGFRRCTPMEAFQQSPSRYKNRRAKDLARTNTYMCKYLLSLNGEPLRPVYLMLPFPNPGNLIPIGGSMFHIAPVLADKAISVCSDHVFVPLNRTRLTFKRHTHHYLLDDQPTLTYVVWCNLYQNPHMRRSAGTADAPVNMDATPAHYLFCKYGFFDAFRRMGCESIKVGMPEVINSDTLPESEWHILSSRKMPPRGASRKGSLYEGTDLRIAIRKDEFTRGVAGMAASFFYILDHFPDRVTAEEIDDSNLWKILLAHVIFKSDQSEVKLIAEIDQHIASLDGYVDAMAVEQFREVDLDIQSIYDLFIFMLHEMPKKMSQQSGQLATLYGKRLMVNRYALVDIVKSIFKFFFQLRPRPGRPLTKNDLDRRISYQIKPSIVTRMNYGHPEVSNVTSAGDNLVFDITSRIVLQSSNTGKGGKKGGTAKADHTTFLNASFAEVSSINHTSRSDPIGTTRINPFVHTDEMDTIVQDPKKAKLLDALQREVQR